MCSVGDPLAARRQRLLQVELDDHEWHGYTGEACVCRWGNGRWLHWCDSGCHMG